MMQTTNEHNHEIRIHPGYNTFRNPEALARSVQILRRAMTQTGIHQDTLGARQRYLRWDISIAPRIWDANGLTYDTRLTYADSPGFRCGICHEYPMYDVTNRKALKLVQRPLIVMEGVRYPGLDSKQGDERMQYYKRIYHQFQGNFTILWHNSYFENETKKNMYCEIIGRTKGASHHSAVPSS